MTSEARPGTILWHDYETFGIRPSVDFPVQFAAIRTDENLQVLEGQANINWLCKMPLDYLPHPQACLVTGITPHYSLRLGLSEPIFAQKIYQQLMQANTCVAGYNSMKFDEEVTRHLLFRNLYPVYEREYMNNNSRWDIIDLVRASYALRPEGINWPHYENLRPCFTLEALCKANNIGHDAAHDALSDVHATIGLAKLIKIKQPKLYDYYWDLRDKHKVATMLLNFQQNMFVYVNGFVSSLQGCCTIIMPVCMHPTNKNAVLCIDLLNSIDVFKSDDSERLAQALFQKRDAVVTNQELTQDSPRVYSISMNKCPFVAPIKTLGEKRAVNLNIDIEAAKTAFEELIKVPHLAQLCARVFSPREPITIPDNIDEQLYTSGFVSAADKNLMEAVRYAQPEKLCAYTGKFESDVINQVLFRYRARNYPNLLDEAEMQQWQRHVEDRLTRDNKKECLSLAEFMHTIDSLGQQYEQYPDKTKILRSLRHYAEHVAGM